MLEESHILHSVQYIENELLKFIHIELTLRASVYCFVDTLNDLLKLL